MRFNRWLEPIPPIAFSQKRPVSWCVMGIEWGKFLHNEKKTTSPQVLKCCRVSLTKKCPRFQNEVGEKTQSEFQSLLGRWGGKKWQDKWHLPQKKTSSNNFLLVVKVTKGEKCQIQNFYFVSADIWNKDKDVIFRK